ncbi:MAG: right-handed parallel beta-helix repeat-containing protein [Acidobacteria bacterium]|nr:right-handed parallel beta-helix repeat-containing protein [Acidobacteriota bacterium]
MRALLFTVVSVFAGALALAQTPPQAREGDSVAWHVVRPGETLSAITYKYLGDASLWPENQRLNPGISDPDKLTPGQRVLVITAREIAARRAKVDKLSRKVDKKLQQESWLAAHIGDQLVEREGLRTFGSSSAELGLDDGTRLQMTENSIVFLREYKSSIRKVDRSKIEVVEGGVDLAIAPAARRSRREVEVLIGDVQARPKAVGGATEARARRDAETKSAKLMVYAGTTEVESAGVKVQVPKGMGTSVKEGAPPAPPQKLLAAPALVTPAAGAESRGATELTWSPVPRAASYIVEVCRDAKCAGLAGRQTGLTDTKAAFASLPAGALFWRVTARSQGGLDGYPSKPRALSMIRVISGRVLLDDRRGVRDNLPLAGIGGALVRLHLDNGDGAPGDGDVMMGEVRTDARGAFELGRVENGTFWVVVEARSASPSGSWREQTYGPAGSLCSDAEGGTSMLTAAGVCYGGRRGGVPDAFETLAGSEHVARVEVSDQDELPDLEFAFSDTAVTTASDSEPAVQGSLRQFVLNSQAVSGNHIMQFVPMEPANATAGDASWWRVSLVAPLPALPDRTLIEGEAMRAQRPFARIDSNPGTLGSSDAVGVDAARIVNPDRPELEIDGRGSVPVLISGRALGGVSNVALIGATRQLIESTGEFAVSNSIIGLGADGSVPTSAPIVGIDTTGTLRIERTLVAHQSAVGIRVWSDDGRPRLVARDLEATGCGPHPVLQIRSSGAVIERSYIHRCDDAAGSVGIEFQGRSVALGAICRNHMVTGSTIRGFDAGIVLRLGAMDNVIEGNVIDASGHGIMFQHIQSFWTPKGNRISRNSFLGGGEPISLEGRPGLGFEEKKLYELAVSCAGSGTSVDRGLDFMGVGTIKRDGSSLRVTGTVCPDTTVEIYARSEGKIEYVGSVKGDAAGAVDAVVETPGGAPRDLALVTIDKTGTTSRMKFGSIR